MALLMVHLLVANRWAQAHGEYRDCPEFYLGAISPDAIHVRDGGNKSRKNEIHLNNWLKPDVNAVLAYWKEHHTPFDIGYGIHVLTDAQWVPRYRQRIPQLVISGWSIDTVTYYNDTYIADFDLYHNRGGRELCGLVARGRAPEDHPLLTQFEIDEWRKWMLRDYSGECPKSDPVKYITKEYVAEFIADAQELLERVYAAYERGEEKWLF